MSENGHHGWPAITKEDNTTSRENAVQSSYRGHPFSTKRIHRLRRSRKLLGRQLFPPFYIWRLLVRRRMRRCRRLKSLLGSTANANTAAAATIIIIFGFIPIIETQLIGKRSADRSRQVAFASLENGGRASRIIRFA